MDDCPDRLIPAACVFVMIAAAMSIVASLMKIVSGALVAVFVSTYFGFI